MSLYGTHELYNAFNMPMFALQLVAEPPKLAEYQTYIDYELKEGDPARVQIIFERALAENCLVPDMWAKYTKYLVSILHPPPHCSPSDVLHYAHFNYSQPTISPAAPEIYSWAF